jgi:aspartate--ammonia ligase
LVVNRGSGINDDLNGIETPVTFRAKDLGNQSLEIVQSLAKWKRLRLAELHAPMHTGIYTDMRALRPDETLSPIHSIYVDQWDWEKVIRKEDRTIEYLIKTAKEVYKALQNTEAYLHEHYFIQPVLPRELTVIHAETLRQRYPDLSPKEREQIICEEHNAVFIIGIGHELGDGQPHDLRSPDYDDWSTITPNGQRGLNGDLLVLHPITGKALELSSMGIRVDKTALLYQLESLNLLERTKLYWHQLLLNEQLPYTIGGGIGQSRVAMFLLRRSTIKEVQQSIWN